MKKEFLKIAGVKSEKAFYEKYPTEEAFFAAHPDAVKKMAKGGTPEAYPQIATFDNMFSYGVPPGPQYLAGGGSAYPMAQTEAQFFVPVYTDVVNPYNMAYGGSNLEMYPNAKVPRVGPTNIFFQDGGSSNPMLEQVVQLLQQGVDPQMVVQQLIKAGVPEQDAVQTVKAVMNEIQQVSQQQQMAPQGMPPMEGAPMMQMGGQEQNAEIGVGNRLGLFMNKVSNMAANAQNKKADAISKGMMKNGGLAKYQSAGTVITPAAGGYRDVGSYTAANPITAYQQQQFKNDPQAYKNFIEGAYRSYYDIDPSQAVYSNDPVYDEIMKSYGIAMPPTPPTTTNNTNNNTDGSTTTKTESDPNKRINVDLDEFAKMLTPGGRIKAKSLIDGVRGRGRSNEYMWQTLFNTDNFAEAQRLAAETGLKIDEGRAGLLGRRKKYSYEWGQGPMPGTAGTPGAPGTPGGKPAGPNAVQPPSGTTPEDGEKGPRRPRRNFFGRPDKNSRWDPENTSFKGDGKLEPRSFAYGESRFDTEGYADLNRNSDFRNWKATQKLNKLGQRLDRNYQREEGLNQMYNTTMSDRSNRLRDRDIKRYNRIANKFGRDEYIAPQFSYGGLPQAAFGLFNKTGGNELVEKGPNGANGKNTFVEKEASTFADDYLKGMENFERNQAGKITLSNFLSDPKIQQGLFGASDPMQRLYANMEAVYPERGIGRGTSAFTFNPINMDTQPYKSGPAYYDNFAAKSLAPSFNARQGGSINQGDIRYMTDEEIAEFVANGGQVEYLD